MRQVNYRPPGPVAARFHRSNAGIRGIMGPVGSGKSVTCCMEIMLRAIAQASGVDGKRKTRWAIVRNTYPELKSTTIKTWTDWFPEEVFGLIKWDAPITHRIAFDDVEMEVLFLALDRPDHVSKLLSLEVTGIWFNEARYIPKALVDEMLDKLEDTLKELTE